MLDWEEEEEDVFARKQLCRFDNSFGLLQRKNISEKRQQFS